jgi:hypothetical protein
MTLYTYEGQPRGITLYTYEGQPRRITQLIREVIMSMPISISMWARMDRPNE